MSTILDNLMASSRKKQIQRDSLLAAQVKRGTLCNVQGLTKGTPLNSNGNRAYVKTSLIGVVNAYIRNQSMTFQSGDGVSLEYDLEEKSYYITGVDSKAFIAAGATVQQDNPNSPDNLFIDSGFILDFLSRPVITSGTSTLVEVKPGKMRFNGDLVRYGGG